LRAFQCPNLVRLAVERGGRPVSGSFSCPACLFVPALPRALAARAVLRSPVLLEELGCLADPGRVHLRIAEPPWDDPT